MKKIIAILLALCLLVSAAPVYAAENEHAEILHMQDVQRSAAEQGLGANEEIFRQLALKAAETYAAADDGEWQYVVLPEENFAVITGHRDQGDGQLDIPAVLGGADVVAVLDGAFGGHDALCSVTMTGNIYYAGENAIPSGVTVRGYRGSYAEKWAADHRHAFENLSKLDFVDGVVDCSDIDPENFVRHDEKRIDLRALEACRLKAGSVFFLLDPLNQYAVSYYKVESMDAAQDGFVTIHCSTPDLSLLLNSFEVEEAEMVADMSTLELAEGVSIGQENTVSRASSSASSEFSKKFSLGSKTLKDGTKISGSVTVESSHKVSVKYAQFSMQTMKIVDEESFEIAFKAKHKSDLADKDSAGNDVSDSIEESIENTLDEIRQKKESIKSMKRVEEDCPLASVYLMSWAGILSLRMDAAVTVEISGSFEISGKVTTKTTHTYTGGKLKSESKEKENSLSFEGSAAVKAGPSISLKLLLCSYEAAEASMFFGVEAKAELAPAKIEIEGELSGKNILQGIKDGLLSTAAMNMSDCVEIKAALVLEGSIEILGDEAGGVEFSLTPVKIDLFSAHWHFEPTKLVVEGESVVSRFQSLSDYWHMAEDCTMTDAVHLMVPSIDAIDPLGSVTLMGKEEVREEPELTLPEHSVRVAQWYSDPLLEEPIEKWPHPARSGDRIYGETEKINIIELVNYDRSPVLDEDGNPVQLCVAESEIASIDESLNLAGWDNIIGWIYVDKTAENVSFIGTLKLGNMQQIPGEGEDQMLMAIRSDDLTIHFRDTDGHECGTLVTGHFMEISEVKTPEFPVPYDPDYAVAKYQWCDYNGTAYNFPCSFDENTGEEITLMMTLYDIERIYESDTAPTVMTGTQSEAGGLTTYSDPAYFTYTTKDGSVTITGFKSSQSYVDESGNTQTWTAVAEKLVVPSAIDGSPVTAIAASAFKGNTTLVSVELPSTVTSIGSSAFSGCTALVTLDMSRCGGLTAFPANGAYKCGMLSNVLLPGSLESIGDYAFYQCQSLKTLTTHAAIGNYAFSGCTALSDAELNTGVTSIGKYAFQGCAALEELYIPCSAASIGSSFISGCAALAKLTFDGAPKTITKEMMAIGANSSLASVEMKLGVLNLGSQAFSNGTSGNPKLTSIILPDALCSVGLYALKNTAVEYLKIGRMGLIGEGLAHGCTTLKEVEITGGVVGAKAFQGCTALEKVTLGDDVIAVNDYAFYNCSALTQIDTGNGIESVGNNAFNGCKLLASFDGGDQLWNIGDSAFSGCTSMTSLNMGSSLEFVGESAFKNCSALQELAFPATVRAFGAAMLYGCTGLKKLTIGGANTPELDAAWIGTIKNPALTTLVIGEGVTDTGTRFISAFTALQQVSLPSTLEEIGEYTFYNLKSLASVNLPSGLTAIRGHAFENCSALSLVCPDDLALERIDENAFKGCTSLTGINLGDALLSVGQYAFSGCTSLKELHFPPSVSSIGAYAMQNCTALEELTIGGPAMPCTEDGWFDGIKSSVLATVNIGEGVTAIGDGTFSNNSLGFPALKTVSLPSTLETIGSNAFKKCVALGEVTLPASLTTIGDSAFINCTSLTLVCPEDLSLTSVGAHAFQYCSALDSVDLGDNLLRVGDYAFSSCTQLEELHFPPSIIEFGNWVLDKNPNLKTLTIGGPGMPHLSNEMIGMQGVDGAKLEKIVIGEGVASIGSAAFSNNLEGYRQLKTVILPSTLETIESSAFYCASALTELVLPEGLKNIEYAAFWECSALDLVCPEKLQLERIAECAFWNCTSLTNINLGSSLRELGHNAFYGCSALKALYVPSTAAWLDQFVNSSLPNLIDGLSSLKLLAIGGPEMRQITREMICSDSLNQIALETLIIQEGVTSIGDRAFNHRYEKLKNISLPSTLGSIGSNAFYGCAALEYVNLPDYMTGIAADAFASCAALKTVHSGAYNPVIAEFAAAAGLEYIWDAKKAEYTVSFMDGETLLGTAKLAAGESLAQIMQENRPADRDGMTFYAWYADAGCTVKWIPASMPACDLTLYAAMTPVYTVRFSASCGGKELWHEEYSVGEGLTIPWPDEPFVPGYRFYGWFTDKDMHNRFTGGMTMGGCDTSIFGVLFEGEGSVSYQYQGSASYERSADGLILTHLQPDEADGTEIWLASEHNGIPVVAIAAGAFADAGSITRLHLPDQLDRIESGALDDLICLQSFSTGMNSTGYTAVNGVLYTKDMRSLVRFPQQKPAVSFRVPAGVERIEDNAFRNAEWIRNVYLPDSADYLGAGALGGCMKLESFTAYGLAEIGENALPVFNADLQVFGPVQAGALRDWLILSDAGSYPVFKARYNIYDVVLYVDGSLAKTLGIEAGSILPADFIYGEMEDGTIIHDWFSDADMQIAWNRDDRTPAANLALYTAKLPIYAYETAEFTGAEGNTLSGILLTAYNGLGGALVLPRSIDGLSVLGIGENFLSGCRGIVSSVQIGSEVMQIADTALIAPDAYPFGGVVKADPGSYAAQWAARMGYTVNDGTYALRFETNGGSQIADRSVACGAYVKLPVPVKTGDEFLGWYLDAELTAAAALTDGCYVMPGMDTTLYAAWAGTAAQWSFEFEAADGEVIITSYTGGETQLTIPDTINGMPVAQIADYAFEGNATLTSLTLPAGIESVGRYAFRNTALQSVDLGGAQSIGRGAFSGCEVLTQITMSSVQTMGGSAFDGCTALKQIHIPASLISIGEGVFDGCAALEAFTADAGNSVYSVQDGVLFFNGTTLLRYPQARRSYQYAMPENVKSIADGAFRGAKYLRNIELSDALNSIGEEAFADCALLRSFVLTDAMPVSSIPDGAFSGCVSLAEAVLSGNIRSIGSHAFFGCSALEQIRIPETVETIDSLAFSAAQAGKLTISGVYGSAAWAYAMEHGFEFTDPGLVPVEAIVIDALPVLYAGDSVRLNAVLSPEGAKLNGDIAWTSSNEKVICIYGDVACAIAPGRATITATAPNGVSASLETEVLSGIAYSMSASEMTLSEGQSAVLAILAEPAQDVEAQSWTSSNKKVVTVKNGVLSACGKGDAVITAVLESGETLTAQIHVAENLNTLSQPAMLTVIGDEAYAGAVQIQCVHAYDGLQTVGFRAFADMPALVQVWLPASAASIATDAFEGSESAVILCEKGSDAESFALEHKLPFAYIAE